MNLGKDQAEKLKRYFINAEPFLWGVLEARNKKERLREIKKLGFLSDYSEGANPAYSRINHYISLAMERMSERGECPSQSKWRRKKPAPAPDPFENMGVQLVKEAATKTNDACGDGTTTSTVLTEAKQQELAAMYHRLNPVLLLKQINENLEHLWNLAEHPAHQHRQAKTYEVSVT